VSDNTVSIVLAITACIAILLSLASLIWQLVDSHGRRAWEAEQDRTRNRWAIDQQGAQNRWQEEQTRAQVAREVAWRQEEVERLAAWRTEDIARQEELTKPRLEVSLNPGYSMNRVSGLSETLLFTEARNVGIVPVFFSNWGGFFLPDGKMLEWPQAENPSKYGTDYDFSQALAPASSCKTFVELKTLKGWLIENGYAGSVELKGYFRDRLDTEHVSNEYTVDLREQ